MKEEVIFLRDILNKNVLNLYKKKFKNFKTFNRNWKHKKKMGKFSKLTQEEGYHFSEVVAPPQLKIFICLIDTEKTHSLIDF